MTILSIESSCDETSAAIIRDTSVMSNIISSQLFHGKFGGVIPELASRAHLKSISIIVKSALEESKVKIADVDALAVTSEPGLIGSLIVGSGFAKGLSLKYNLPLVPVNHIEGHLYSGCLQDSSVEFPFITLVVSGGHTALFYVESFSKYEMIGSTIDDAAGEAFDKIATMLGLPYPGGPQIDKLAKLGNPETFKFPRSMINSKNFDFSFSGLKTSVRYFLAKEFPNGIPEEVKPNIAASLQQAIVDVLTFKTICAALDYQVKSIIIAGGVSANSGLRNDMAMKAEKQGIKVVAPELNYCMDNAAMIGFIADKKINESGLEAFRDLTYTVNPTAMRAKRKK
jgi:N6-L-threonylcarbamoyladenine synthase